MNKGIPFVILYVVSQPLSLVSMSQLPNFGDSSPSRPHGSGTSTSSTTVGSGEGEDKTNPKAPQRPAHPHCWGRMGQLTHVGIAGPPVPAPSLPLGHKIHLPKKIMLAMGDRGDGETVGIGNHHGAEKSSLRWETIIKMGNQHWDGKLLGWETIVGMGSNHWRLDGEPEQDGEPLRWEVWCEEAKPHKAG